MWIDKYRSESDKDRYELIKWLKNYNNKKSFINQISKIIKLPTNVTEELNKEIVLDKKANDEFWSFLD